MKFELSFCNEERKEKRKEEIEEEDDDEVEVANLRAHSMLFIELE